jgi:hypothetical protein
MQRFKSVKKLKHGKFGREKRGEKVFNTKELENVSDLKIAFFK